MALPTSVKSELIALNYLNQGGTCGSEAHSLKRLQSRALTGLRMMKGGGGLCTNPTFKGTATGKIDQATVDEIALWKARNYVAPLGIYKTAPVAGGKLREDVAQAWSNVASNIAALGGTIAGPYGDTLRPLMTNLKAGASRYSFHYVGRAVDLNQGLGGGSHQRYYIVQDAAGSDTYWRIYCKTDDQTGKQGTLIKKNTVNGYRFGDGATYPIQEAYYIDLTAEIQKTGLFERIKAQSGWSASGSGYNKTEWWHFQYVPDKESSFQDATEFIGITEKKLRDIGYTDADLDHSPG